MNKASRPFFAAYNSFCENGDMIFEGDEIVMADGVAYHSQCAREDGYVIIGDDDDDEDDFFG